MINGIYAASLSLLNENLELDYKKTIFHAEQLIDNGCHGVVFFGSTGQSQLISLGEKIQLIKGDSFYQSINRNLCCPLSKRSRNRLWTNRREP